MGAFTSQSLRYVEGIRRNVRHQRGLLDFQICDVFASSVPDSIEYQVICMKLGKEVVPFSDRIMNILVEVFKNKQAVAQVCEFTTRIFAITVRGTCTTAKHRLSILYQVFE